MWTDKCHKCGRKIFNGIPDEHRDRISDYIKEREVEGWYIGYNTTMVGEWGNYREVPIKPICNICSNEEYKIKTEKKTKKALRKVIPTLKKVFVCPVCEYNSIMGQYNEIFKSTSKAEMIKHIEEKHNLSEIESVVPHKDDQLI